MGSELHCIRNARCVPFTYAVEFKAALRTEGLFNVVAKIPFVFSHVQYCDMQFVYGFCDGNARDAVQEYQRRFPDGMASLIGVSRMQVWRTLHEKVLYPYHDQRVQHLEPGDHARRMDLCNWIKAHTELLRVILFSDEASFTRDGANNSRNVHM